MTTLAPVRTKVLPVPYLMQPTDNTCQSTCLRMMASYIEQSVLFRSTGAGTRDIKDIWQDVNAAKNRPSQVRNSHANFKWWLERNFPSLRFEYTTFSNEADAVDRIVSYIDGGLPVLMSVSHADVKGHIVLVVGYENYVPAMSTPDFKLVMHDPYGRFDPSLNSDKHGKRRWHGGMSLPSGGEEGPGKDCHVDITAVSRHRRGDKQLGTYYLLSARR